LLAVSTAATALGEGIALETRCTYGRQVDILPCLRDSCYWFSVCASNAVRVSGPEA